MNSILIYTSMITREVAHGFMSLLDICISSMTYLFLVLALFSVGLFCQPITTTSLNLCMLEIMLYYTLYELNKYVENKMGGIGSKDVKGS